MVHTLRDGMQMPTPPIIINFRTPEYYNDFHMKAQPNATHTNTQNTWKTGSKEVRSVNTFSLN